MSDLISRQAAIEALVAETIYTEEELKEYYEANSHRNEWVNGIHEAVEVIKQLPPAQLAPSQVAADIARIVENGKDMRVIEAAQPTPDQNGDLWITVPDIDKVTCIYVQESKSKFCRIFYEER